MNAGRLAAPSPPRPDAPSDCRALGRRLPACALAGSGARAGRPKAGNARDAAGPQGGGQGTLRRRARWRGPPCAAAAATRNPSARRAPGHSRRCDALRPVDGDVDVSGMAERMADARAQPLRAPWPRALVAACSASHPPRRHVVLHPRRERAANGL